MKYNSDGGPSRRAKTKEKGGQTVGATGSAAATHGKPSLGTVRSPVLSFQFASLLASKLLKFLYILKVLEGN